MTPPLAVTGWSAVSALGIGAEKFSDRITSGRTAILDAERDDTALPAVSDGSVPGFDIRHLLGRKNTRAMDRITGLTVLTVGRLLDAEQAAGHDFSGHETGFVLGTTTGSVQSMMDFTRDSFTQDRPYLVDPARFPYAVMNCAAGQSAIWHGLRGPNATVASGQVAGLSALRYASRLCDSGHARSVLCGAVEELTPQRVWLEQQRQEEGGCRMPGEGCAMFRLESLDDAAAGNRPALAYLLATAFRVAPEAAAVPRLLGDCARSALQAAGATPGEVWAVAADLPRLQYMGLSGTVGGGPRRISLAGRLGDTGAASAALLLAAVLSYAAVDPASGGRVALLASADREGLLAAAAFRLPPATSQQVTSSVR